MPDYCNLLHVLSDDTILSDRDKLALLEPFTFIKSNPGKGMRTLTIEAFDAWLNVPPAQLKVIVSVVDMLHHASLLIDDIQDNSVLRRGKSTAHKIYGVPLTINSANYVLSLAYQELYTLRRHSAAGKNLDEILTTELICLHSGQGLELLWRESLQCPTEEQYINMVKNKTGGLFRMAVKLMMACSTTNTDVNYIPLVNLLGVYFQIRDDLMNLQSTEFTKSKGLAEDLTEGKFSFPVIHSIHADVSNRQVLDTLRARPTTPTLKERTIEYLKNKTKSFDYTLNALASVEFQMRAELERLGGSPRLQKIMDALRVDKRSLL